MDPSAAKKNDASLMSEFCKLKAKSGASDNRLSIVNEVRMWLRVITVAELAGVNGACISLKKFEGRWINRSTYLWLNVPRPSKKMFEIFWLYNVRKILCINVNTTSAANASPLRKGADPCGC